MTVRSRLKHSPLILAVFAAAIGGGAAPQAASSDPPLTLARDGYFYVNAKTTTVDGKSFITDQMYVECASRRARHGLIRL